MKEPTPRIKRLMSFHGKTNTLFALASGPLAAAFALFCFGFTLEALIIAMVGSWLLFKLLSFLSFNFYRIIFYGFSLDELAAESADAANFYAIKESAPSIANRVELTVMNVPENPIGTFKGAQIYEWMDLKGEDEMAHRFFFSGTMNLEDGISHAIPDGCILFPPGILYQVETANK